MAQQAPKLIAVASAGGHWIQLLRLRPAFAQCQVTFLSTHDDLRGDVPNHRFYAVNDASRSNKLALAGMSLRVLWILARTRPQYVISTGAAPGYVAIRIGRLFGARTIWVDSLANADELSLSGKRIGRYADLWLTQWPHLASPNGPTFAGAVL
jgi:UDP-N-acetylglucosamine:LPS N-acetylglucosamine transferase